jgi:magnesium-transporting ATPase (P-type)
MNTLQRINRNRNKYSVCYIITLSLVTLFFISLLGLTIYILISNDGKSKDPFVFGIHIYLFLVITFFVISLLGTCISCGHWIEPCAWYESGMHNSDIP